MSSGPVSALPESPDGENLAIVADPSIGPVATAKTITTKKGKIPWKP